MRATIATGWDDDENNWWMKLAAYTYLADGKVGQIDFGNGVGTGYGYDERGMIQIVDHYNVGANQDYSWRQYWRDNRDRITAFQKNYNPESNPLENGRGDRFRYDEEGQLVEAWYNATDPANSGANNTRYDGFGYDALGNRTQNNYVASRGQTSFVRRDNGLNQYSSWSPSVIYHDDSYPGWSPPGNGVTMTDGWITASYNALNQPVAVWSFAYQGTSNFMWFGYDPLGRCVKRWVGDSGDIYSNPATYFHYDGWSLLQEGNNAWGPARVYIHGNGLDEIVWSYNTFTGEQAFHQYDARGHCTLLTDRSGNILEQYEYDAFGQPYFYDASGNSIGAVDAQGLWAGYSLFGNRFLFTGREWLADAKVYDYRNRMYQPELGRFMQPDPKQFAGGDYNLYRYCHNDPVNKTDAMGLADSVAIEFVPAVGKMFLQILPDAVVNAACPGCDSASLMAPNGGLTTTVTTDKTTGDIHVQQRIKIETWIPKSQNEAGKTPELTKKELLRVEKFREGVPEAQRKADALAAKGFKDEASAKQLVEKSTKDQMLKQAREGQLKWDLPGGKH